MTVRIPLTAIGTDAEVFNAAVEAHRAAVEKHMLGPAGVAAPRATDLIESLIVRIPDAGPVAERGPDKITIKPYEIYDDRPVPPEVQALRDSILNP